MKGVGDQGAGPIHGVVSSSRGGPTSIPPAGDSPYSERGKVEKNEKNEKNVIFLKKGGAKKFLKTKALHLPAVVPATSQKKSTKKVFF